MKKCQLQISTYCEKEVLRSRIAYYKTKECCKHCYDLQLVCDKSKREIDKEQKKKVKKEKIKNKK